MNVGDIISRVQRLFGDESGVQIDDTDIIRYINDAQRQIVIHNATVLESTTTIDIVAEQNNYQFPSDALVLRSLRVKLQDMLAYQFIKFYNLQEFDRAIDGWDGTLHGEGFPFIYTLYGNEIFLFPTPRDNATAGLKVLYSPEPADVTTDSDALSLPYLYHNAILSYCMKQVNVMDEDYEASAVHETEFVRSVSKLNDRQGLGPRGTYPTITTLPEDM